MRRTLLLMMLVSVAQSVPVEESIVQVIAETSSGETLSNPRIRLIDLNSGKELSAASFRGGTADHIPRGSYELEVTAPGFVIYKRQLDVFDERVVVRAPMQVGDTTSAGASELSGDVVLLDGSARRLWVVLFPISRSPDRILECLVGSAGHFTVKTTSLGPYLLTVIENHHVLHSEEIYLGRNNPRLKIVLSSGARSQKAP